MHQRAIERVWIEPGDVRAAADALRAIVTADLVIIGPGSLYTSVLPSLLIPEIREALAATTATRVYVCNVATQEGETEGYDLADHIEALVAHVGGNLVDVVLADGSPGSGPDAEQGQPVRLRWPPMGMTRRPRLVLDDVVAPDAPHRHDPQRLADALIRILQREGSSRPRPAITRAARSA